MGVRFAVIHRIKTIVNDWMVEMKYLYTTLCNGYLNKPEPCKYIDSCDLCIGFKLDEDGNEHYIIGRGCNAMKCKRDNPNYKPLTKSQFIEIYRQMPNCTNISLGELLERARIDGMVEG